MRRAKAPRVIRRSQKKQGDRVTKSQEARLRRPGEKAKTRDGILDTSTTSPVLPFFASGSLSVTRLPVYRVTPLPCHAPLLGILSLRPALPWLALPRPLRALS